MFRVEDSSGRHVWMLLSRWFIILRPWRRRRYPPPKRRLSFNILHGVISEKTKLFDINISFFMTSKSAGGRLSLRNGYQESFWARKPIVYKLCEPRCLTKPWASTDCYTDSFTLYLYILYLFPLVYSWHVTWSFCRQTAVSSRAIIVICTPRWSIFDQNCGVTICAKSVCSRMLTSSTNDVTPMDSVKGYTFPRGIAADSRMCQQSCFKALFCSQPFHFI
jgi:hypothetical protein